MEHFLAFTLVLTAVLTAGFVIGVWFSTAPEDHRHRRSALLLDGCPRCGRDVDDRIDVRA